MDKLDFFKQAVADIKPRNAHTDVTLDTLLSDLGIDSLDAVELQMYYEEKTGIITKDPDKPIKTVGDLLELMP